MKRREFINTTCLTLIYSIVPGLLLTDCKTVDITESNGEAIIPSSKFGNVKAVIFTSKNFIQKIIVVKEKDETYKALLLKCTHKGAELELKGDILVCPLHNSKFDLEGNVVNVPASGPLKAFPVLVRGRNVIVQLA